MPGRAAAPKSGRELEEAVTRLAGGLGLEVRRQVKVGRRLWGQERRIDIILTEPVLRKRLGLECKYQGGKGSADEKIPATISDIAAWPIPGLVVFSGAGFTANMRSYLLSTGRAVEMQDLEPWLRLFFGLELPGK